MLSFQINYRKDSLLIHIKDSSSPDNNSSTIEISPENATLYWLQNLLFEKYKIPIFAQKLFLRGKRLDQVQNTSHPESESEEFDNDQDGESEGNIIFSFLF